MASNSTPGTLPGGPALNVSGLDTMATAPVTIAIAVVVVGFLILHILSPSVDPREPPLVKPRIPLIGHILGLMRHQASYHIILQRSTGKPIATLPMLTGKVYAVWDPHLIAAGLRNKNLSSTPHIKAVTPAVTQVTKHTADLLTGPEGDHLTDRMMLHAIPNSLKGASIQRLNETALAALASSLSAFAATGSESVPNAWLWLRRLITSATGKAVYGPEDPFAKDTEVEDALWDLEANLLKLSLNLPAPLVKAGHRARAVLQQALMPYYAARHDEDAAASDFVRLRAAELRTGGLPDDDIARLEMMLPFAALANTVPLLFWLICNIFSRPELVEQLRQEVEAGLVTAKTDDGEVTLLAGTAAVEERCPLLMSCYRETLRRTVHQVSTRTAMQDTVLTDRNGRQYLLKAGTVVQMAIGASHAQDEYWGGDVDEFKPDRFIRKEADSNGEGPGSSKAMRAAFQPFGGGVHLCPGRYFAFAEMMAVVSTLLLGFEVEPLEGTEWKVPGFATRSVIDAVTKPAKQGEGFGMRFRRRQGWENVRWVYQL
ncbi:cytochrome P450 [Achaetomium macrosporum]|uniref:Cytochrome P450 n=1 Tax=Achaetomium macrosporum TaxID=79813 RepID=A0AAN7CA70_9PEZI|nr:cytochrome P450 [Achaetomium macrosporum]